MATNPPKGTGRVGAVRKRVQVCNPKNDRWTEIDTSTHKFINQMVKKSTKFKGVRKIK